jgi:hypothetical protein
VVSLAEIGHPGRVPDDAEADQFSRFRRNPLSREDIMRSLREAKLLIAEVEVDQNLAELDDAHIVSRDQREVLQRMSNQLTDLLMAIDKDA